MQQCPLVARRRTFPSNQAQASEALFIARGDRNKSHLNDMILEVPSGRQEWVIKRNRQSLSLGPRIATQSNQRRLVRPLQSDGFGARLIQICLAPAKYHHAAPTRIQHAGGALGEPFQERWQIPRMRGIYY